MAISASERREQLKAVWERGRDCRACQLHETRTTVVFGAGNADAELMFIGEAPGANEDQQGIPFVGQAGKLLDRLLGEIGLARSEVFIANTLMCRPPGNRNPHPHELEACQGYLHAKIALIEPTVICTLGNFATKLLRGDPTGISRLHGQAEVRTIGRRAVRLYPLLHPAAALYTPSNLAVLQADFARIPGLLAEGPPPQPPGEVPEPEAGVEFAPMPWDIDGAPEPAPAEALEPLADAVPEPAEDELLPVPEPPAAEQLGLFSL